MWLNRKRYHHADHLIYMLKEETLLYYETCHNNQELRFEGSNLAQKCCKQILARSLEVPAESIHVQEDRDHYYMQSVMDPLCTYQVKLLYVTNHVIVQTGLEYGSANMSPPLATFLKQWS